ncbi:YkgJ family cysteine cluster protein, partial [Escherichia coli]|nr:YkgJ family cysteine cluster protein [Escherichia coli]
ANINSIATCRDLPTSEGQQLPPLYKDMLFHTRPDAATRGLTRVQLLAN